MPYSLPVDRGEKGRTARGCHVWKFQLVYRRQIIKVVRGYRPPSQRVDAPHEVRRRHLRVVRPLDQRNPRLCRLQLVSKLLLGLALFLAPLGNSHLDPPGPSTRVRLRRNHDWPFYSHGLYSDAIYKRRASAIYSLPEYLTWFMEPGNRLRIMRKRAELTQQQLADQTGVSQPAISQLENGTLEMSFSWARTFARVLGCAFVDLIADADAEGVIRNDHERQLIERYRLADEQRRHDLDAVAAALMPLPANEGRSERAA